MITREEEKTGMNPVLISIYADYYHLYVKPTEISIAALSLKQRKKELCLQSSLREQIIGHCFLNIFKSYNFCMFITLVFMSIS